jgi:hypothetical protein
MTQQPRNKNKNVMYIAVVYPWLSSFEGCYCSNVSHVAKVKVKTLHTCRNNSLCVQLLICF